MLLNKGLSIAKHRLMLDFIVDFHTHSYFKAIFYKIANYFSHFADKLIVGTPIAGSLSWFNLKVKIIRDTLR